MVQGKKSAKEIIDWAEIKEKESLENLVKDFDDKFEKENETAVLQDAPLESEGKTKLNKKR